MDWQFGAFRLMGRERRVTGPQGALDVSDRGFDILEVLLRRPNEPVSKAQLLDAAWPGVVVEENNPAGPHIGPAQGP